MRRFGWILLVLGSIAATVITGIQLWLQTMQFERPVPAAAWSIKSRVPVVEMPGRVIIAEVAWYDDEMFAYLMFSYLRNAVKLPNVEVLLTYQKSTPALVYKIQFHIGSNLLTAIPLLAQFQANGVIDDYNWRYLDNRHLATLQYQTHVFQTAYNLAAGRKLENLSATELRTFLRRFIRFKSATDPRIRRDIEPVPYRLTDRQADRLAADIIAVSDFFSVPLDFFIGIGAMENNFMNIRGDLDNTIWKRRASKHDVVLERRRGRVLVLNDSAGVWQITRETLRYAHRLYRKDNRDYTALPERLRPPDELDVNQVDPDVLTTYAGLLLRDLLDRFDGDVALAVGAYNGGPRNPNPNYEAGVRTVAAHARQVIEQAALLNGRTAAGMKFFRPKS
jgi:hypothetical protein